MSGVSGTAAVAQLCEEFWEWRVYESPEFASLCGDHRYDNRLNDYSEEAFQQRLQKAEEFLTCAKALDGKDMTENGREDLLALKEDLRTFMSGMKFKAYVFLLTYNEALHNDWAQLISWMKFDKFEDYQMYLKRLRCLPAQISQVEKLMRLGVINGMTRYSSSLRGIMESLDEFQQLDDKRLSVYFQPFKDFNEKERGDQQKYMKTLENDALKVISEEIQPAYLSLRNFIAEEYLPNCRKEEGVHCLPNGEEFYQECLDCHLTLKMSPKEVHEVGLREVERIRNEMEKVKEIIGFEGDLKGFLQHLRTDKQFYFDKKEDLLNGYRNICDNKIRPNLGKLFNNIPSSKLIIKEAPESKKFGPAAYYMAGTLDGSRPGTYFVNCHQLQAAPKFEMTTLSLHEGEPGHHFQGMYAIEMKDAPKFRKYFEDMNYSLAPSRFSLNTAFGEGWALYCEYLGKEMGLYDDPYQLFGYLTSEIFRASRLVVDTGLHAFGWSAERAVQYMMENTAVTEEEILSEVCRYITWPGQACAYKIGELKILELRAKASAQLGDGFNIADFHDILLRSLMVPMSMLEHIIDMYIERTIKTSS